MKQLRPYCNEGQNEILFVEDESDLFACKFSQEENILYIVIYAMVLLQLEVDFLHNAVIGLHLGRIGLLKMLMPYKLI